VHFYVVDLTALAVLLREFYHYRVKYR